MADSKKEMIKAAGQSMDYLDALREEIVVESYAYWAHGRRRDEKMISDEALQ